MSRSATAPPRRFLIERNGVLGIDCDGRFIPAICGGTGAEIALLAVAAVGAAAAAYGTYAQVENQKETLKTLSYGDEALDHELDRVGVEAYAVARGRGRTAGCAEEGQGDVQWPMRRSSKDTCATCWSEQRRIRLFSNCCCPR